MLPPGTSSVPAWNVEVICDRYTSALACRPGRRLIGRQPLRADRRAGSVHGALTGAETCTRLTRPWACCSARAHLLRDRRRGPRRLAERSRDPLARPYAP